MVTKQCFYPRCAFEVEMSCHCTSPYTYSCETHWGMHIKSHKEDHVFELEFTQPVEETKKAIIMILAKEISKKEEFKKKILDSFSQNIYRSETNLREQLKKLEADSAEISSHIDKVFNTQKILKSEQDPILRLLTLSPAEAIICLEDIIPKTQESHNNAELFYGVNREIEKMIESFIKDKFEMILNERLIKIEQRIEQQDRGNKENLLKMNISMASVQNDGIASKNEFEKWMENTENEIKMLNARLLSISEDLENNIINSPLKQLTKFYENIGGNASNTEENKQNFPNQEFSQVSESYYDYPLSPPLFLINKNSNGEVNLLAYNTESERELVLDLPTQETFDYGTCITSLPNKEIFCFGSANPNTGISAIIDQSYGLKLLPSGKPCCFSSAVYFKRSIFCFGGQNEGIMSSTLSEKFDLEKNKWVSLKPLPKPDQYCNSIIFDGDILISGCYNKNILRYRTMGNYFTRIDYEFSTNRKILISLPRLYLIECKGYVYESEINDENNWKKIGKSIITSSNYPGQLNCQYSKGAIYIGVKWLNMHEYYKFDLSSKTMLQLSK
ncbi:unnamed protein product [Blepharisma stoltei]|uniref:Uncharacterized protein n=1 Tax=Blepharisma stoltei TaxID=1481888 RepID=A0AAU9K4Y4_9CILI|nr:unnamed protein product [Blepharisma stoltei]